MSFSGCFHTPHRVSHLEEDADEAFLSFPGAIAQLKKCNCSASVVIPTFPHRIPTGSQLRMLQLSADPGEGVHIHAVVWTSILVVPQEARL